MTENTRLWDKLGKVYGNVSDRIENRVATEPNTGCWLCLGSVHKNGYGTITVNRKTMMVHRASYEAFTGPIPDGLAIDHKCKVRSCVNPAHLEAVTYAENNRRSPRVKALPTHCKNGHELSGANLYPGKYRRCATCARKLALSAYYRKKEASHV